MPPKGGISAVAAAFGSSSVELCELLKVFSMLLDKSRLLPYGLSKHASKYGGTYFGQVTWILLSLILSQFLRRFYAKKLVATEKATSHRL
jgi:hypothetical protein